MTTPNNADIMAQATAPRAPARPDPAKAIVDRLLPEMARALPQHVGRDRMARMLLTTFRRTPKLMDCKPESVMAGILEIARLGLEPGVEVHLIPFKGEAQVIVGYQGLVRLMYQSGYVTSIQTGVHREGDEWEVEFGLTPKLRHVPGDSPGKMLHVYAIAHLRDGGYAFRVMTKAEVDRVAKSGGPWREHYEAMAEKTVLRRLAKYIPQSPEMMSALRIDERSVSFDAETGETDFIDVQADAPEPVALSSGPDAVVIRSKLSDYLSRETPVLERLIHERVGGFTSLEDIDNCEDADKLMAADAWVARVVNGGA